MTILANIYLYLKVESLLLLVVQGGKVGRKGQVGQGERGSEAVSGSVVLVVHLYERLRSEGILTFCLYCIVTQNTYFTFQICHFSTNIRAMDIVIDIKPNLADNRRERERERLSGD